MAGLDENGPCVSIDQLGAPAYAITGSFCGFKRNFVHSCGIATVCFGALAICGKNATAKIRQATKAVARKTTSEPRRFMGAYIPAAWVVSRGRRDLNPQQTASKAAALSN